MPSYASLDIRIDKSLGGSYEVELRFVRPSEEVQPELERCAVSFNFQALDNELDMDEYGRILGKNLFDHKEIRIFYEKVLAVTQSTDTALRIKLIIGLRAADLHRLKWETLCGPDESSIATNENIIFSRYLIRREDFSSINLTAKHNLRALAIIANPNNISDYEVGEDPFSSTEKRPLTPIDVESEFKRAKSALGAIPLDGLPEGKRATLNNIFEQLRKGYDILYLVCHGAFPREPKVWLEKDDGTADEVSGTDILNRIRGLTSKPTLAVLASCESAGSGRTNDAGSLSALGPGLVACGIPAVIAMQGNITVESLINFMPTFFTELQKDGQIDRAMAIARSDISSHSDSWIPVLYLRLVNGRIWYDPGFAEEFNWDTLLRNVMDRVCTPVLGAGLIEPYFGSSREIAQYLAEKHRIPLVAQYRGDLPQVTQYLSVFDEHMPRGELIAYLKKVLLERYGGELRPQIDKDSLVDILREVGNIRRTNDSLEPHKILATLPFEVFITTNPDFLLEDALIEVEKKPVVRVCPWDRTPDTQDTSSCYYQQITQKPNKESPIVYHLFGHLEDMESLVLTEDSYFDYLIGSTLKRNMIPHYVSSVPGKTALLFLGFKLDEWSFRVMFRNLINQESSMKMKQRFHVAVQVDPEESRFLGPKQARDYLRRYFQNWKVSIYWGSVEDFMKEFQQRWKQF